MYFVYVYAVSSCALISAVDGCMNFIIFQGKESCQDSKFGFVFIIFYSVSMDGHIMNQEDPGI